MKKIMVVLFAWAIAVLPFGAVRAQTTPPDSQSTALAGSLFKTNVYGNVFVAAVYARSNDLETYACVGTVFPDSPSSWGITVPEQIFPKGLDYCYAVKIPQPSGRVVTSYINNISSTSKDNHGMDIVFATLGQEPRLIKGFSEIAETGKIDIWFTNELTIRQMPIRSIHSLATGKESPIIGYGLEPGQDKGHPFVLVEAKNVPGDAGTAFYDEYKRLFILHGGMATNAANMTEINADFGKKYGRNPEGVALLVGPIVLE